MSGIKGIQNSIVNFLDEIGNLKNNFDSLQTFASTIPENNEWVNHLNEQIGERTDPETKETFRVKLPADQDPQKLRDNLLRDEFGFTDEDIKAYDKATENKGFYLSDSENMNERATAKDVKTWKTSNGFVEVNVENKMADDLRAFRINRVVDKSLENITDPFLRETVKSDLMKIYKSEGFDKTNAAERLLALEVENHDDARTIQTAIRTLSEQKETKNNAVVQILTAKVDLAEISRTQSEIRTILSEPDNTKPSVFDKILNKKPEDNQLIAPSKNPIEILMPTSKKDIQLYEKTKDLRQKVSAYQANLKKPNFIMSMLIKHLS